MGLSSVPKRGSYALHMCTGGWGGVGSGGGGAWGSSSGEHQISRPEGKGNDEMHAVQPCLLLTASAPVLGEAALTSILCRLSGVMPTCSFEAMCL